MKLEVMDFTFIIGYFSVSYRQWSRRPGFNSRSSLTKDFKKKKKKKKMLLDISLLNTWHYKVCIKGKVEQSRERSSALPHTSV